MKVKIHKSYRVIVAICDSDLIGKTYEQGEKILEIRENFYNGEEIKAEKAIELLRDLAKEDATFNIVGKESTETALKAGIISKEGIKKVKGIPFALILL